MRPTPYIYIFFFLGFLQTVNSQDSKTVKITGSDKNETTILRQLSLKKTIVSDSSFSKQIRLIRKKIDSLGFTNHQIENIINNDSTFEVKISLQHPVKMVIIQHPQNSLFSKIFKLKQLDDRSLIVPFSQVNYFLEDLIAYYQNNGFPFVEIKLMNIKKKKDLLFADLAINKLTKRIIDQIIIKGYSDFPESFIKYELNINPKEIFDKKKIVQTSKQIQKIAFVNEIKKPEILFKKDSTNLYLYLKKKMSNQFDGLIGFSSNEQKKIAINGYLNLKLLNILNYGENFELNWLSDGNQSQNLKLKLEMPYLFKSPLSSKYNFSIFKKDSSFITISHFLNVNLKLSSNQKIGFIVSNSQSNNNQASLSDLNIADFTTNLYGISYSYIKPNNHPFFKTKFCLESSFLLGKRNTINQTLIDNTINILFPINSNNNITVKNNSRFLFSSDYVTNELFRIGGSGSIRGFNEQSIFSDKYSYFNIDYNYIVNDSTFFSIFSDIGYIGNFMESQNYSIYSFGFGYTTKVTRGLLNIQYSIGNTSYNHFSFNNSKLHLKFSQFF